jgi:threonine dehydrogenase-like Zn-dependent dehydrogenase
MRAIVTQPGSGRAWVNDIPEPTIHSADDVLVEMLRVGVCGTDRHVMYPGIRGDRALPTGDDFIVMGHEAIGRVVATGAAVQTLKEGDFVVPTVRRGCGQCDACNADQADLCSSMLYRERGIVGLHGFLAERIVDSAENLVHVPAELAQVGPLVESLCTPEKALRRIANARAHLPNPTIQRALVTGTGPIALIGAMALRLRNIPTTILARQPPESVPAQIATRIGASYVPLHTVDLEQPQAVLGSFDAIIEATGAAELCVGMLGALGPNGVLDLVGGTAERKPVPIQASALGAMVGRNLTMLGSVNANNADWRAAVEDLTHMRSTFPGEIEALITHRFGMNEVDVAFERTPGQIKAVIEITG